MTTIAVLLFYRRFRNASDESISDTQPFLSSGTNERTIHLRFISAEHDRRGVGTYLKIGSYGLVQLRMHHFQGQRRTGNTVSRLYSPSIPV